MNTSDRSASNDGERIAVLESRTDRNERDIATLRKIGWGLLLAISGALAKVVFQQMGVSI